jgi:hypothetical protein
MSIGFLLPGADAPVTWRGLMVQKAVQQLLFDVDWRGADTNGPGLDLLVVDMPPGTGDVPLSLGQLVKVDGAGVSSHYCFQFIICCGALTIVCLPHRLCDRVHAAGRSADRRSQRHLGLSKAFCPRTSPAV